MSTHMFLCRHKKNIVTFQVEKNCLFWSYDTFNKLLDWTTISRDTCRRWFWARWVAEIYTIRLIVIDDTRLCFCVLSYRFTVQAKFRGTLILTWKTASQVKPRLLVCKDKQHYMNEIFNSTQLAFYVNLHRAVIGPSATLTGRWRPDIDLRRMLTGYISATI